MKINKMNSFKLTGVLTALGLCLLLGCGGDSDGRLKSTGTVTLDGSPLPTGNVVFYKDNGSAAVGVIEDGKFTLKETGGAEGIQPGTYQVSIDSWEVEPNSVNDAGEIVPEGKSRIPEKYTSAATSELSATVSESETDFTFELKSE